MGIDAAKRFSVLLVTSGCIITSGLAEGIDEIGHRTAVDYGTPTIAVLGHGINIVFLHQQQICANKLLIRGVIISEYLPKTLILVINSYSATVSRHLLLELCDLLRGNQKAGQHIL